MPNLQPGYNIPARLPQAFGTAPERVLEIAALERVGSFFGIDLPIENLISDSDRKDFSD